MIQMIQGNLIEMLTMPGIQAVAHGCNCFNKMGAGFALQLATAVPEVLTADLITVAGDTKKLGTFSDVEVNGIIYYNLYTQFYYGKRDINFDLMAFQTAFSWAIKNTINSGRSSIHIPMIGAGLGGGNWDDIYSLIQRIDRNLCGDYFIINIVYL